MKSYEISKGILVGLIGFIASFFIFAAVIMFLSSRNLEINYGNIFSIIFVIIPLFLFYYFKKRKYACIGIIIAYLIVAFFLSFAFLAYPPAISKQF